LLGSTTTRKKKSDKIKLIKDAKNYVENPNQEKSRNRTQIHYLSEKLQGRRESRSRFVQWHSQ